MFQMHEMHMHVCCRSVTSSSPKWDARLWGALVLLCGIVFLDGLDVSMVGVALPSIQADLGLSTSQLQWIVSAYVQGLGGLLLLGGRAAFCSADGACCSPRWPCSRSPRSSADSSTIPRC